MLAAIVNNVMLAGADPAGEMIMPPVLVVGPARIPGTTRLYSLAEAKILILTALFCTFLSLVFSVVIRIISGFPPLLFVYYSRKTLVALFIKTHQSYVFKKDYQRCFCCL